MAGGNDNLFIKEAFYHVGTFHRLSPVRAPMEHWVWRKVELSKKSKIQLDHITLSSNERDLG